MSTAIVWFRNDLRLHDHPALTAALAHADTIIPLFILNDTLLSGPHASANRNQFLLQSLENLRSSFRAIGGELFIRSGNARDVLLEVAKEHQATEVYCTKDYTPYSTKRDDEVKLHLLNAGVGFKPYPGRLVVDSLSPLTTKNGNTFQIFSPFYRAWLLQDRRHVLLAPKKIAVPKNIESGVLADLKTLQDKTMLSPHCMPGGEAEARKRMHVFLDESVGQYHERNDSLAEQGTSKLSPYLHFGCISARELESLLTDNAGAQAYRRQLCWRDFITILFSITPRMQNRNSGKNTVP